MIRRAPMPAAFFAAIFAALALAAPGATSAQEEAQAQTQPQTQPRPIYSNRFASGWDNWSWADVVVGVASTDDERPIQVNAAGWQALYLHHAPFSTEGFTNFSFWINGGARGGQTISVVAIDANGEVIIDRAVLVTAQANEWVLVEAPLSELGAAGRTVSGFWIQNGTPDPAPVFFVTEIALN
jgi:chitinase